MIRRQRELVYNTSPVSLCLRKRPLLTHIDIHTTRSLLFLIMLGDDDTTSSGADDDEVEQRLPIVEKPSPPVAAAVEVDDVDPDDDVDVDEIEKKPVTEEEEEEEATTSQETDHDDDEDESSAVRENPPPETQEEEGEEEHPEDDKDDEPVPSFEEKEEDPVQADDKEPTVTTSSDDAVPVADNGPSQNAVSSVEPTDPVDTEEGSKDQTASADVSSHHHDTSPVLGNKFTQPVYHEKIKTPTSTYGGGASRHHDTGLGNRFTRSVCKDKIKTPTSSHVGVKHHAAGHAFFTPPKHASGMTELAATRRACTRHHADGGRNAFFHAPAAERRYSLVDTASRANIAAPKGRFQWVMVNGVYRKQQVEG